MPKHNQSRRDFINTAALTLAATQFSLLGKVVAQDGAGKQKISSSIKPGSNGFGPMKQVDAGVLNVSYAEEGPGNGPVVILFHGWP